MNWIKEMAFLIFMFVCFWWFLCGAAILEQESREKYERKTGTYMDECHLDEYNMGTFVDGIHNRSHRR